MLLIITISITCIESVSAQSVQVVAVTDGGEFSFVGDGGYWDWDIDITGFDEADTDLTNHWDYATSTVTYQDIDDGTIKVRVKDNYLNHEFTYYDWGTIPINGNGIYVPKFGGGGRYVNVTGSPNVTGFIECVVNVRPAYFQFDTRHSTADLTVIVHNGELLENATVELINGPHEVAWTDENGAVVLEPTTGKYAMIVEHENFSSMLVDDLYFENDKSYIIKINMTDCLSSCGLPYCTPDYDDLIMFYKSKEPAMNAISPQSFVNFFAQRLTTCMAGQDKCAIDTLERMYTNWGIEPDPALGVLLYDCNFTKLQCDDTWCEWEITYEVRNFQSKPYDYTVTLIADNTTTELNSGTIGATFSTTGRETLTKTVVVNCNGNEPGCSGQMYLAVISERAE